MRTAGRPALTPVSLCSAEAAEDKQRYLQHVERFCRLVKNDWYRVYLVRKLASERGIEFVQRLSRPGHPARWVFPQAVLAQQVSGAASRPGLVPPPPPVQPGPRCLPAANLPRLVVAFRRPALGDRWARALLVCHLPAQKAYLGLAFDPA